jgi:ABC-type Fe3+ transport system permease subunit
MKLTGSIIALMYVGAVILLAASVLFIVTIIKYVKYLKEEKCKCSEGYARDALEWLPWVIIGLWVFAFVLQILIVISTLYHLPGEKTFKTMKKLTSKRR